MTLWHMCVIARAPKLRHLARTIRIDLDWLFERFYRDPSRSITYVNTKEQAADIFTKANFTAAQWQALLDLIQTQKSTVPEVVKTSDNLLLRHRSRHRNLRRSVPDLNRMRLVIKRRPQVESAA